MSLTFFNKPEKIELETELNMGPIFSSPPLLTQYEGSKEFMNAGKCKMNVSDSWISTKMFSMLNIEHLQRTYAMAMWNDDAEEKPISKTSLLKWIYNVVKDHNWKPCLKHFQTLTDFDKNSYLGIN